MERGENITLACKEHQLVFVFWLFLFCQSRRFKKRDNDNDDDVASVDFKNSKTEKSTNYFFSPVHTVVLKF